MTQLLNQLFESIALVLSTILNLLPESPFKWTSFDSGWLGAINWIFPLTGVIAHLEAYVFAVAVYYGLRIILRWVKAAGN